jgi:hypothetical protein
MSHRRSLREAAALLVLAAFVAASGGAGVAAATVLDGLVAIAAGVAGALLTAQALRGPAGRAIAVLVDD